MTPDPVDRLNRALEGRYHIEGTLGEGGMAVVYLADDLRHERKVALKVLKPELAAVVGADRFLSEIKTTANLQHPHILPLYDSGEADGFLFYVMPYVEGESLRERLDREGPFAVGDAVRIAMAVAGALDYAHRHGVVHRDVKPGNILMQDEQPVVGDFGIALAVGAAGGTRLTETGLSVGSAYYMSPEQATADRDPGPRSDVYSLACVVYEMLTGEPPFTGRSAVVAKILTDSVRPPRELRPTVPGHVDAAVRQALRKIPADRFATAAAFAGALNDPSFTLSGSEPGFGTSAQARSVWNPVTIAATALAAGLLAFTGWSVLQPDPSAPVRRYSLALPAAQALDPSEDRPRLALSPDGERLVYVGPGPQGIARLWVRALDELDANPLPGTEGAAAPFFSPDGSRIGFLRRAIAGGEQEVAFASLTGGPSVTLVDEDVGLDGAVWGTDGFVYYDGITGAGTTGLMRVSQDGGAPEQVTVVDTAGGETDHVWPDVLPDARGLLFTILRGSELERADVAVFDFETGEKRVIVRGTRARYVDPGYLVFVGADGTLRAMPFDARRLERDGETTGLADGLSVRVNGSVDLEISPSGALVYVTGELALEPRELTWVDREGRMEPADPGWMDDFRAVSLSPDGSRVAVGIAIGGWEGSQDIYIKQLSGGPMSRVTVTENIQNHRPEWTPDGGAIAFLSNRAGESDVYRRPADGTAPPERIIDGSGPITDIAYTRDGEWLVYVQEGDLLAVRTNEGSDPIPVVTTPAQEGDPAVSPDGRWLAYTSNESGRTQVYVSPFPNTGRERHTVTTDEGFSPLWAHDGGELFYKTPTGDLVTARLAPGEAFRIEERKVLFTVTIPPAWRTPNRYAVSPDGDRFLIIRERSNLEAGGLIVVEGIDRVLRERLGR